MANTLNNIHEQKAKAVLLQYLLQKGVITEDVVIINELALEFFSRRADIALVNGSIEFFEIKSEADTLTRLPGQIETFSKFCDKLHVVGAACHIENILKNVPENVAVWQLDTQAGIKIIQRGRKNILRDKKSLLKLINGQELKQVLARNGVKAESNRRKHMDDAVQDISAEELRSGVLEVLKRRYAQSTEQFMAIVSQEKVVHPNQLNMLKRDKVLFQKGSKQVAKKACYAHLDDIYMQQLSEQGDGEIFGALPEEVKQLIYRKS